MPGAAELNKRFRTLAETIRIEVTAEDLQEDKIHLTTSGYDKWKVAVRSFLVAPGGPPTKNQPR